MKTRVTTALSLCLLLLTLGAGPTNPVHGLAGTTWHTVRIDGDGLFFVIRDIGIRFEDDQRFTAAVRFLDGQQSTKTGRYQVTKKGTLLLTIEGLNTEKILTVRRVGRDLVIHDKAFDVTLRLAPGKMEEERWF
jgi:hypothetical protein